MCIRDRELELVRLLVELLLLVRDEVLELELTCGYVEETLDALLVIKLLDHSSLDELLLESP